jgi:uroporphyrinogen decarboxylase
MTPRERVSAALAHRQPDRPPIDLGSQSNSTLTRAAFDALMRALGKDEAPAGIINRAFQSVESPEWLLERFGADLRGVKPGKPRKTIETTFADGSYTDYWGVTFAPALGGTYYDVSRNPLREAEIGDLDSYRPFDPADPAIGEGVEEKARKLFEETGYALVGNFTESQIFERAWHLRGFDQFLMDLHIDKRFAHRLLRLVTDIQVQRMTRFLEKSGRYFSLVKVSDDLAGQLNPLISPETYREMIMPYHREYFDCIRKHTDGLVALHCCGAARLLLPSLIEAGVRIFHPFQPSCEAMDPAALKREFGRDLVFWGGMDTQKFLPKATTAQVRAEVRRIVSIMAPGGGYIFSPSHNLQGDVPPENVVAMYEEARAAASG